MSTHPNAPDAAVDELKRRARRRLMGAIVLALAAAIVLPMLLESDPKPLGNDVSIQIPPIDSGKFVTPLSQDHAPGAPSKVDTRAAPATPAADQAPSRTLAASEQRVLGQPAAAVMPSAPEAMRPAAKAPAPTVPIADMQATARPSSAVVAPTDAGGLFVVQVAALADAAAAAELAAKLNAAGFSARVEPVATSQGSIQRVRVGAFASRDSAAEALAKIKSAGYGSAIVTGK